MSQSWVNFGDSTLVLLSVLFQVLTGSGSPPRPASRLFEKIKLPTEVVQVLVYFRISWFHSATLSVG